MSDKQKIWNGPTSSSIPNFKISHLNTQVASAVTGPDTGIHIIDDLLKTNDRKLGITLSSTPQHIWTLTDKRVEGLSTSLYNRNPVSGKFAGDPNADTFAVCARRNSALLVLADGVNWGEDSRLAARAAVHACFHNVTSTLFPGGRGVGGGGSSSALSEKGMKRSGETAGHVTSVLGDTKSAMDLLLASFTAAHSQILAVCRGFTTLCAALVLPVSTHTTTAAVCVVSVGDSTAYILNKTAVGNVGGGLQEVTVGARDLTTVGGNNRDTGGALGPVLAGDRPELNNLTCSLALCQVGDIVFLTSDGISDNFDPIVNRIAVEVGEGETEVEANAIQSSGRPLIKMTPKERHHYTLKEMERVWHELEISRPPPPPLTGSQTTPFGAADLCRGLLDKARQNSAEKRTLLEQRRLYRAKSTAAERENMQQHVARSIKQLPGKLDHATIVAYQVFFD